MVSRERTSIAYCDFITKKVKKQPRKLVLKFFRRFDIISTTGALLGALNADKRC